MIEAMKQALEALEKTAQFIHDKSGCTWMKSDFQMGCRCSEDCSSVAVWKNADSNITALRQAIEAAEKQEPEPVGYFSVNDYGKGEHMSVKFKC